MQQTIDLAVSAKWIIPIIPKQKCYEDCTLLVADEKIHSIVPSDGVADKYIIDQHIQLHDHVLMPGLVNCHGHSAMTLLRGFADDHPLMTWLEKHIWPVESQWVSNEFVKDGAELAIAEMLLAGTTCFSDMYFFPEATAKAAFDSGMRAQLVFPIMDFPCAWGSGPDNYIEKGLKLHDNYRAIDRISIGFGPHAPYTVSDAPLERIVTLSQELQAPVQSHAHETAFEVSQGIEQTGMRPLKRLADIGLISPLTQLVHMTQINDDDIALLQKHNPHVFHCPHSNLKLASGFCPVDTLKKADVNVAIGTDGAASNNGLSLFDELRTAAMLSKAVANDASSLSAFEALEMATINGANALGLSDQIGSLEVGKCADFIAIQTHHLQQAPTYNIASQLVYTNMQSRVSHVWVNGKCLVNNHALQTLDIQRTMANVTQWQTTLSQGTQP